MALGGGAGLGYPIVMTVLGKLSRAEIEAAADRRGKMFDLVLDLLMEREPGSLTKRQLTVWRLVSYDNEVSNGGHLQYFHNQERADTEALPAALAEVGAFAQRDLFGRASAFEAEHPVERAESLVEYHARAVEQEFWELDKAYYALRPELGSDLLPAYVEAHLGDFVELD